MLTILGVDPTHPAPCPTTHWIPAISGGWAGSGMGRLLGGLLLFVECRHSHDVFLLKKKPVPSNLARPVSPQGRSI